MFPCVTNAASVMLGWHWGTFVEKENEINKNCHFPKTNIKMFLCSFFFFIHLFSTPTIAHMILVNINVHLFTTTSKTIKLPISSSFWWITKNTHGQTHTRTRAYTHKTKTTEQTRQRAQSHVLQNKYKWNRVTFRTILEWWNTHSHEVIWETG